LQRVGSLNGDSFKSELPINRIAFMGRDPAVADENLYRYCGDNPTIYVDPSGLASTKPLFKEIDPNCPDTCGPDVTEWFLKDLKQHLDSLRRNRKATTDDAYFESFRQRMKYLLAYKWMPFGTTECGTGKCKNTVMFAGVCMRKNQLGNIAFGFLTNFTGLINNKITVSLAYSGVPYLIPGVNTYDKTHPYANNFGKYIGAQRADNLAAFSLGAEISAIPLVDTLSLDKLAQLVLTFIKNNNTFNKYASLYYGSDQNAGLTLDNLTFVPEYEGFNTQSCKPCKGSTYSGRGSEAWFTSSFPFWWRTSESELDKTLRQLEDYTK
jgi:hypothetical protein